MKQTWLVCLLLPLATMGQLPIEGFGDFDDLCPYLFDRATHGADEVIMDLHWGSYPDKKPSFHDRLRVVFVNDTNLIVLFNKEPLDTMSRMNGEWVSNYDLIQRTLEHRSQTDSAGFNVLRELYRYTDGKVSRMERLSRADSSAMLRVTKWAWSDGNTYVDSMIVGNDGTTTQAFYSVNSSGTVRTMKTNRRTTEFKGHRVPTLHLEANYCATWTYELDRDGRITSVDHFGFNTGSGEVGGHDHLLIRYKR